LADEIRADFPDLPLLVTTSVFAEGLTSPTSEVECFERKPGRIYLLLYVYNYAQIGGRSIYGYDFLLENLHRLPEHYSLVVVDLVGELVLPVGPPRIHHLKGAQPFSALLRQVDIYIRPTSTDGASVSVFESLQLGTPVVASDVVDRKGDVILFRSGCIEDFLMALEKANGYRPSDTGVDSITRMIDFYHDPIRNRSQFMQLDSEKEVHNVNN
jgi:glycosyltransferase involved in cell wall biosynthesis